MAEKTAKQAINSNALLLNRPFSSTGLPGAVAVNINGNGSVTPIDYYCEALEGERLMIARIIVNIKASGNIATGEYGDIAGGLANGIDLFYRTNGVILNVTDGLPVKINEDWGKWCYDARINAIGATTNIFQARWTLTRFGTPYGIILEEGDRLGVRVNDNLSTLSEQTIVAQGLHLGTPNPAWADVLPALT